MFGRRDAGTIATGLLVAGLVACGLAILPRAALGTERFALPKEVAVHTTAALAALACLAGRRALLDRRLALPLVAVVVLAAASFLVSGASPWEAARTAGLLASAILVFLCARVAAVACPRALAIGVAATVTALAAAAIAEAHGWLALSPMPPGGVIGNRNALAHLVALALPLLVAVALAVRHRLGAAAAAAAIAIAAHALVLTRCRAAWLALAVAAAIALLGARRTRARVRRTRLIACVLALTAGAGAAVALPNQLAWSTASPYRDTLTRLVDLDQGSGHGRLLQYRATLAMAADHPWLGVGPGNWSVRYPDYAAAGDPSYAPAQLFPVNRLPSSDWIGLCATLGIPALAALAVFAARYAQLAIRRRSLTALAALAVLTVLGTVDTVLGRAAPALVAAIVLGALLPAEPGAATSPRGRLLGGAIAAAALACGLLGARLTAASLAYDDGRDLAALETAARIAPGSLYFPTYLATRLLRGGDCARGAAIATGVLADYPHLVALRGLARACESTTNRLKGSE